MHIPETGTWEASQRPQRVGPSTWYRVSPGFPPHPTQPSSCPLLPTQRSPGASRPLHMLLLSPGHTSHVHLAQGCPSARPRLFRKPPLSLNAHVPSILVRGNNPLLPHSGGQLEGRTLPESPPEPPAALGGLHSVELMMTMLGAWVRFRAGVGSELSLGFPRS